MQTENLEEIVRTEAELAEALLGLLKQQQNAIIYFQDGALTSLTEQQEHLLRPLEALEKERARILAGSVPVDLALAPESARRLRTLAREIADINRQNRTLLEQALRFIHQNLRILTENFTRKMVDARI
jgi:flagellar biosynthesis/type III secretory pathway chaperone